MGGYSTAHMLISIVIAIVVTAVAAIILFRYFGDKGPWRKVVLQAATTAFFALLGEVVLLSMPFPSIWASSGLVCIMAGMIIHSFVSTRSSPKVKPLKKH